MEDLLPIYSLQFTATKITVSPSVSKELDNYGYKLKMSFVIPVALQIYIFSKNKNVIGYMQESNRTLLKKVRIILSGLYFSIIEKLSMINIIFCLPYYDMRSIFYV